MFKKREINIKEPKVSNNYEYVIRCTLDKYGLNMVSMVGKYPKYFESDTLPNQIENIMNIVNSDKKIQDYINEKSVDVIKIIEYCLV